MCLYFSCGICTHYTSRPSSARFLLRNLMWESLILIVRGQQYENCGTLVRRTVSLIQRQQKKPFTMQNRSNRSKLHTSKRSTWECLKMVPMMYCNWKYDEYDEQPCNVEEHIFKQTQIWDWGVDHPQWSRMMTKPMMSIGFKENHLDLSKNWYQIH